MNTPTLQARDLLKTEGIFKAHPDDSLSSALKHLTRTHDAIFVFDDKDKFLGIINPHHAVFTTTYPAETKLINCIFHPPVITPDTYLWDIAKLMSESKVYFLPVFDKNKFIGIVTLNRILGAIRDLNSRSKLSLNFKKKVITVDQDATLEEVYSVMRDQQVSRLPVVNGEGHLIGLVTRYDIQKVLATPKEKPRFLSYVTDKENFLHQPLEGHYRKLVVTVTNNATPGEVIENLLTKNVGSVVVTDSIRKPIGIISTHDILKAVDLLRPKQKLEIDLDLPNDFVNETQLVELINAFAAKIEKSYPIKHTRMIMKAGKNAAGKTNRYKVTLEVEFKSRKQKVTSHAEGYEWKQVVREALSKARGQLFD